MTHVAFHISKNMHDSGITPGIVDLYRVKPIAKELVEIAKKYERVVTIEEHTLPGGMGSAVVEFFADNGLLIPVKRFGISDVYPQEYGDREWMLSKLRLNVFSLTSLIKQELHTFSCEALDA